MKPETKELNLKELKEVSGGVDRENAPNSNASILHAIIKFFFGD